jgi:GH25 family lysozyme M1 (1,4-beta-N-acetylmuramidase)
VTHPAGPGFLAHDDLRPAATIGAPMTRTAPETPRPARRRTALAAAVSAAALACGAATAAPASAADYSQAPDTVAGSQILRHEGVQGTPRFDPAVAQTLGHDVSGHQGAVDWGQAAGAGARFVYVKATEGTGFVNPQFGQQYNGAHNAGIIRGAYHFARPDISGGAQQADYFIAHGGGWRRDGTTLPGVLDIEYNPYGDACYGKDQASMTAWIADFASRYLATQRRSTVIYTSTSWWKLCTGNASRFGNTNPLWLARYAPQIGELPAGWDKQSIWQFSRGGALPGDQNYYNGPMNRVQALAGGAPGHRWPGPGAPNPVAPPRRAGPGGPGPGWMRRMTFAVGLFDVFAYTVPGALYLALLAYVAGRLHWLDVAAVTRGPAALVVAGALVAAYLLGYLAYPVGARFSRWLPRRKRRDARAEFLRRNPSADGRAFVAADTFLLHAALQIRQPDAATEVSRTRSTGLMVRNASPAMALGFGVAAVELFAGPKPWFAAASAVLCGAACPVLIVQHRMIAHWAKLKTLELAFWDPDFDELLDRRAPDSRIP